MRVKYLPPPIRASRPRDQAFTLMELMVVVVILALLAAIAVPSLVVDSAEEQFDKLPSQFLRDVQRAHFEAISARQDRALLISSTRYSLNAVVGGTYSLLAERQAPVGAAVSDIRATTAAPWNKGGYSTPTSGTVLSGQMELRFLHTGQMLADLGSGLASQTVSVFFESTSRKQKARVVIYPATSYGSLYKEW